MPERTGRRLLIRHRTGFRYGDDVEASFNEVRMTPLTADGQLLISHSLEIHPSASVQTYDDYWGAHVESFDVHVPHKVLEIVATSTVHTPPTSDPIPHTTWDNVHSLAVQDRYAELLAWTDYVDDPSLGDRAPIVEAMRAAPSPQEAADLAMSATRERIVYASGVTNVSTTAAQAWESQQGVCQDFTHAMLSLLRGAAIPARYVSGYLHTEDPAPGQTVVGESHAWVEYWDGDWQAVDPTNDRAVGAAHVIVARGRDYADVPPLKGIYAGGHGEGLGVSVEITQL
jgi:transglutaminase-like putative cysteine protease